jgi:amidase
VDRREFVKTSALAIGASLLPGQARALSAQSTRTRTFPEYDKLDGLGLADLVQRREISPTELLDAAIERVELHNPGVNAVINKMYDHARSAIAAGLPSGPFTGVPFLLKDTVANYAGVETSNGSEFFRGAVAANDSELVVRMKRAGLVIFGKTNLPEMALNVTTEPRRFGPTRNPWNAGMSTGGSSGGSAAAVAARMVPMAHGTDGGGSLRIPASMCGMFGLKPTRARNPSGPDAGEGWNGSTAAHAITRSVRDSAALLDATSGPDVGDPYWAPPLQRPLLQEVGVDPGKLRIAFTATPWNGKPVDPECVQAMEEAIKLCADLGHHVEEATPAIDEAAREKAHKFFKAAHTRRVLELRGKALGREPNEQDVERYVWYLAEIGRSLSAVDYANAITTMHKTGRVVGHFFAKFDVLVTPVMCLAPYKLGVLDSMGDPDALNENVRATTAFTSPFNTTGNPAMSVPLHWTPEGMPVGVQFVGRFGDEATLFRLAAQLEAAKPWAQRRFGRGNP